MKGSADNSTGINGSHNSSWPPFDPAYSKPEREKFFASREWAELRWSILKRDGFRCQACNQRRGWLNVDHIVPISVDWSRRADPENLACLCFLCNRGKGRTTADYRSKEPETPVQPDEHGMVTFTWDSINKLRTHGTFTRLTREAMGVDFATTLKSGWLRDLMGTQITWEKYQEALAGVGMTKPVVRKLQEEQEKRKPQPAPEARSGMIQLSGPVMETLRSPRGGFSTATARAIGVDKDSMTHGWVKRQRGRWITEAQYLAAKAAAAGIPLNPSP